MKFQMGEMSLALLFAGMAVMIYGFACFVGVYKNGLGFLLFLGIAMIFVGAFLSHCDVKRSKDIYDLYEDMQRLSKARNDDYIVDLSLDGHEMQKKNLQEKSLRKKKRRGKEEDMSQIIDLTVSKTSMASSQTAAEISEATDRTVTDVSGIADWNAAEESKAVDQTISDGPK